MNLSVKTDNLFKIDEKTSSILTHDLCVFSGKLKNGNIVVKYLTYSKCLSKSEENWGTNQEMELKRSKSNLKKKQREELEICFPMSWVHNWSGVSLYIPLSRCQPSHDLATLEYKCTHAHMLHKYQSNMISYQWK